MERQAKDGTFYKQVGQDEWAPVTRTAKDGTVYKKVGADSWSPASEPVKAPISKTESAARGVAQGGTFGFADELTGALQAIGNDIGSLITGKQDPNAIAPKLDEFGRVTNPEELTGSYVQRRDESRSNYKAAEAANPGAYIAGEIAGGLASAAVPLGSAGNIYKAAQAGARAGAAGSLGFSEADNAKGLVRDVAVGTGLGAAGGAVARGAEKVFSAVKGAPAQTIAKEAAASSVESGAMKIPEANSGVFKDIAKSAKNRIKSYWNPDVDPSYKDFVEIAKKNGIDPNILPESVKFGPDSAASRSSRALAEGKYGEETLKKFNQALGQVRESYDKKIQTYSKGLPIDEVSAGKILRDSYDEGVSKFFDQMDFTHNTVINQAPGLQLTPKSIEKISASLNGVEKFAKGRMARGVTETQRKQGQQLINAIEAIRSGNGSYKQTVEALRDIGEAAFQSKNSLADVPVDVQKMRKIYNDLNEGLIDTVRSNLGDDIANSLVANNKAMSEFFGESSLVSRVMGDKSIAPEQAFRSLVLNGDSQKIQALKKILPPEKWEYFKGAVLENLAKRDPEGDFTFKQLFSSVRNKKNSLASIFEPEELADNLGIIRLGDRFGSPVLSSSGTGASLSFNDIVKEISDPTVNALAIRNANKSATSKLAPEKSSKVIEISKNLKDAPSRAAGVLIAAPEKGPDKWASDGVKKLQEHDPSSGISDPETISRLKKSKKGKDLLIQASDLKPGTKAMDNVLRKIKEASLQGSE